MEQLNKYGTVVTCSKLRIDLVITFVSLEFEPKLNKDHKLETQTDLKNGKSIEKMS